MGNDFTKRLDIRIYIDYYSFWPDVIEAYPGVQDYWVVSMDCVAVKIRNKNGLYTRPETKMASENWWLEDKM